jgi:hypothetical protein
MIWDALKPATDSSRASFPVKRCSPQISTQHNPNPTWRASRDQGIGSLREMADNFSVTFGAVPPVMVSSIVNTPKIDNNFVTSF